jgi:hypothetical protein
MGVSGGFDERRMTGRWETGICMEMNPAVVSPVERGRARDTERK